MTVMTIEALNTEGRYDHSEKDRKTMTSLSFWSVSMISIICIIRMKSKRSVIDSGTAWTRLSKLKLHGNITVSELRVS